ncbi:MAG: DUF523 domain-containing protein [Clostridiales bacterium]|nr:DUF523 domain-containing protein [Clostridiales bacterium]
MKILVSACLLGCSCRYDGKSKPSHRVLALRNKHTLIPVCPEQLGGLPTPRPPAEIQGEKVISNQGADVTAAYQKGAREALFLYETLGCQLAILKSRSPSCGCGQVYDGAFSDALRPGDGVTAALLKQHGIRVLTEEEHEKISQL